MRLTKREQKIFDAGIKLGLEAFAISKEGTRWVGNGRLLDIAVAEARAKKYPDKAMRAVAIGMALEEEEAT